MPDMERLQSSITVRQQELHRVADLLSARTQFLTIAAATSKVVLIVLGAISATQGTVEQILGKDSIGKVVFFTIVGVIVAAVAGLEAAFKYDSHATEFRMMAAECQATLRAVDTTWQKQIGAGLASDPASAAEQLLDVQDTKLADIQQRAAKAGFNITFEVRELFRDSPKYAA